MHDPVAIPQGIYVWEHIPELKRKADLSSINEEDWKNEGQKPLLPDLDKVVRLVIFMVSPRSPYYEETDYQSRLNACLAAVKIPKSGILAAFIIKHHWWYLRVLNSYLMLYSSTKFSQWMASRVALFGMFSVLMQPNVGVDANDTKGAVKAKKDALDTIEELNRAVSDMERALFPMDTLADYSFRQAMFDLENTAEHYAKTWDGF